MLEKMGLDWGCLRAWGCIGVVEGRGKAENMVGEGKPTFAEL